jgi:hypothetical protein
MNTRRHHLTNVLATGVVATILVLIGLFWGRTLCSTLRHNWLFHAVPEVRVSWSGPFPWKRGIDPNLGDPHLITARPSPDAPLSAGLGLVQYVLSRLPTGPESDVYNWNREPNGGYLYYDRTLGQIVHRGTERTTNPDGTPAVSHFTYYAGPEGVASAPDEKLGRFVDPVVDRFGQRPFIVYDRGSTRFFRIDWAEQTVRKGPELPEGRHGPVQIGVLQKNPWSFDLRYVPGPRRESSASVRDGAELDGRSVPSTPTVIPGFISMSQYLPVLDSAGRIYWLDVNTLELGRSEARLFAPADLYGGSRIATPKEVAAYSTMPISIHPPGEKWTYGGCAVAALARDGTSVRLEMFDPNGQVIASDETAVPQFAWARNDPRVRRTSISSPEAAYFHLPGARGLTLAKFALESLHPPILHFLSYFGASRYEATAAYRSLLLLPDSFLAQRARVKEGRPVEEFFASMVFLIPAFVLVLLFAWRVDHDGGRLGLSKNVRTAWITGVVVFGLPAYITYRLTRPKVTLVTCANCGLGRRPALEKCHHCGSPWSVPELVPPAWRVLGEPEEAEESSASEARQAKLEGQ